MDTNGHFNCEIESCNKSFEIFREDAVKKEMVSSLKGKTNFKLFTQVKNSLFIIGLRSNLDKKDTDEYIDFGKSKIDVVLYYYENKKKVDYISTPPFQIQTHIDPNGESVLLEVRLLLLSSQHENNSFLLNFQIENQNGKKDNVFSTPYKIVSRVDMTKKIGTRKRGRPSLKDISQQEKEKKQQDKEQQKNNNNNLKRKNIDGNNSDDDYNETDGYSNNIDNNNRAKKKVFKESDLEEKVLDLEKTQKSIFDQQQSQLYALQSIISNFQNNQNNTIFGSQPNQISNDNNGSKPAYERFKDSFIDLTEAFKDMNDNEKISIVNNIPFIPNSDIFQQIILCFQNYNQ